MQDAVQSLKDKLNKISDKLSTQLDIASDISVKSADIVDYVNNDVLPEISEQPENYLDVFSVSALLQDFTFIRETLRANTTAGKNLLNSLSTDLSVMESQELAQLVESFAELNRSITDSLKLYVQAYKDLSNILVTLQRSNTPSTSKEVVQNNTAIVMDTSAILKQIQAS